MEKVNVLVGLPLDKEHLDSIAGVDPRVKATPGAELMRQEIRGAPPEALNKALAETEAFFTMRMPPNLLARAPRLRWVQLFQAGTDMLPGTGLLESPVVITSASGGNAVPVAEHALALALMLARRAPLFLQAQRERRWERHVSPVLLAGKTAGVVGLGHIGREVARRVRAFDMKVLAIRRGAQPGEKDPDVDELYSPQQLTALLARSDFVFLCLPLLPDTRHLMGEAQFRAMKSSSFLINVARGALVEESALVQALKEERLAGAGVDVFEKEPLPQDSPLWETPNLILSPHIAGGTDQGPGRTVALFCENLKRYLAGKPLINVVDKEKGY